MGRTKHTPDWSIEMNETQLLQRYTALHDGLSDMIEGGRLTHEMIPDDYDWLLLTLLDANGIANKAKTAKAFKIGQKVASLIVIIGDDDKEQERCFPVGTKGHVLMHEENRTHVVFPDGVTNVFDDNELFTYIVARD